MDVTPAPSGIASSMRLYRLAPTASAAGRHVWRLAAVVRATAQSWSVAPDGSASARMFAATARSWLASGALYDWDHARVELDRVVEKRRLPVPKMGCVVTRVTLS